MLEFLQSIALGVTIIFIIIGLIGAIVPLLPGIFLVWLAIVGYWAITGFNALSTGSVAVITLIALAAGSADLWLTWVGSKKGGAGKEAVLYGIGGAILGTFLLPLLGTIIGYIAGLLYGEYRKHGDWDLALKAGMGGLAGWGVATAVQFISSLIITGIFAAQLLAR